MCSHLFCGFSRRVKFFFYWLYVVLISALASSRCGSQSDQTKDYKICVFSFSTKTQHNRVEIKLTTLVVICTDCTDGCFLGAGTIKFSRLTC